MTVAPGAVETGADWTVAADPEDELPPPTCTVAIESLAEFGPLPAIDVGAFTVAVPAGDAAPAAAPSVTAPDCAEISEPLAVLPPPSWIDPTELPTLFAPPAIAAVPATLAEVLAPAMDAPAVGDALVPLTCTLPAEPPAELPPPTCAVPSELDAVFDPPPPTVTGTLADAALPAAVADAVGCAG